MKSLVCLSLLTVSLCACTIGPDYVRPEVTAPKDWKTISQNPQIEWQTAQPKDWAPKPKWWELYEDTTLNTLEEECLKNNQTLIIALAKIDQANAGLKTRSAAQLPVVQFGALATDTKISADRPLTNYSSPNQTTTQYDLKPFVAVSYEFDWLGKIRRDVEAARASADQAQTDFENVKLIMTAQLAQLYFLIRQTEEEIRILQTITQLQSKSLNFIKKRHANGLANQSEVDLQNSALQVTLAQMEILKGQRNVQENSLASMVGVPAPSFRLAEGTLPKKIPDIPKVIPSSLLERRPDIASAERAMAAANAQIGVAKAAYYPSLLLAPSYAGYEATTAGNLFLIPQLIWSIGLSATQTLFDGGRLEGGVNLAKASYTSSVASYRQTILSAFEETQNALGNLEQLSKARVNEEEALQSQNRALKISNLRYEAGLDNINIKLLTEQNQLNIARTAAQFKGSQLISSVGLIKAMGGGWDPQSTSKTPN